MGWSKDLGPTNIAGRLSAFFIEMIKTLSIFVDESGDFGEYNSKSPYYLLSLVFHDQDNDISDKIKRLDIELDNLGIDNHLIHTEPLIRRESPYRNLTPNERRAIFTKLYYFMIRSSLKYKTFIYNKAKFSDKYALQGQMAKDISIFLQNCSYLKDVEKTILYYDNGQTEITHILNITMSICFANHEIRKINPFDYKLFQVADLICSIELVNEKIKTRNLTTSEKYIFHTKKDFKKDFYKNYSKGILS